MIGDWFFNQYMHMVSRIVMRVPPAGSECTAPAYSSSLFFFAIASPLQAICDLQSLSITYAQMTDHYESTH